VSAPETCCPAFNSRDISNKKGLAEMKAPRMTIGVKQQSAKA
jgi:hypothetical protein